jgi:hypothetical protein
LQHRLSSGHDGDQILGNNGYGSSQDEVIMRHHISSRYGFASSW